MHSPDWSGNLNPQTVEQQEMPRTKRTLCCQFFNIMFVFLFFFFDVDVVGKNIKRKNRILFNSETGLVKYKIKFENNNSDFTAT